MSAARSEREGMGRVVTRRQLLQGIGLGAGTLVTSAIVGAVDRLGGPLWRQVEDRNASAVSPSEFLRLYDTELSQIDFGTTYAQHYIDHVRGDGQTDHAANIRALKHHFGITRIRLPLPWDRCEVKKGAVDISPFVPTIEACEDEGIDWTMLTGLKTTRWAEVHAPAWLQPELDAVAADPDHNIIEAGSAVAEHAHAYNEQVCEQVKKYIGEPRFLRRVQWENESEENYGIPRLRFSTQYMVDNYTRLLSHFPGRQILVNTGCISWETLKDTVTAVASLNRFFGGDHSRPTPTLGLAAQRLMELKHHLPHVQSVMGWNVYEEHPDSVDLPFAGYPDMFTGLDIYGQKYVHDIVQDMHALGISITIEEFQGERWGAMPRERHTIPGSVNHLQYMTRRAIRYFLPISTRNEHGKAEIAYYGVEQKLMKGLSHITSDPAVAFLRAVNQKNLSR